MRFGDAEMKKVCATFTMLELSCQGLKIMFILLFGDLKNQHYKRKISFAFKAL